MTAISSRNTYLNKVERQSALIYFISLKLGLEAIKNREKILRL